jgi:Omp85 superfamily domain
VISLRQGTWTLLFAAASATVAESQNLNSLPVACKGERISRIDIDPNPPFRITGDNILKRVARFAAKQHTTTKETVIRRFLALQLGDRCTELRRAETERILRSQPFIADASVLAYPDGNGGVTLLVTTVDEVSLIVGAGIGGSAGAIHALQLGDDNLMGSALHVDGVWRKGQEPFRDTWAGKVVDYQFLGRPYQLVVEGGRRDLGSDYRTELTHPFLTDLQRLSWRTTAGNQNGYFYFRRPGADPAALRIDRSYSDVGGVVRIGPPLGRLALVGGSLSFEDEVPEQTPVTVTDLGVLPDTSTALINRYTTHQTARVNALWGVRNVHFMRVSGFDALEGTEDLRTGFQVATLLGKGVTLLRGKERDLFGSTDLYAGIASPISYTALEVAGEGRRDEDGNYDGLLAHGRGALYLKPFNRQTLMSDLTFSGGWKQRIPFQLSFADRDGGLRGFRSSDVGGARRLVARVEDRYLIGRYKQFATVAIAGFADAGKLWAGDTPFGQTTPWSGSVGFSVLAASPPMSRRTARVDFAFPVRGPHGHSVEVRFLVNDFTRVFRTEPRDIFYNRERSVPSSVFNWP